MPQITEREALRQKINALPWFHQIDFGDGLLSPGVVKIESLRAQADAYFDEPLEGLTVLDIGCWDGYKSFEVSRRGAKRVLATDHFVWSDESWGSRKAFELAREHLAPDVEVMDIDILDLRPETVGTFDIVLFCGIFYHLRDPFLALTRIAPLARRTLIVETHLDAWEIKRPAMMFYPAKEQDKDPSNWWGPNPACIEAMLQDVGFPYISSWPNPAARGRGIFHARRQQLVSSSRPPAVLFSGWAWRRAHRLLRRLFTQA